jgi:hypothetical protein
LAALYIQPSSFFLVGLVEIIISLSGVKVHIGVLGVEFDHLSPPALLKQFEEVLIAKSEVERLNIFFLYSILFHFINFWLCISFYSIFSFFFYFISHDCVSIYGCNLNYYFLVSSFAGNR